MYCSICRDFLLGLKRELNVFYPSVDMILEPVLLICRTVRTKCISPHFLVINVLAIFTLILYLPPISIGDCFLKYVCVTQLMQISLDKTYINM